MRCGIIGLPQAGKTSIFRILTHVSVSEARRYGKAQHIGVVQAPDERLDRVSQLVSPAKITPATLEYVDLSRPAVDVAALGQDALRESEYLASLRLMDALLHVVRLFLDDTVPHTKGSVDPQRDISGVELDLILTDLGVIENRRKKLEHDRKKMQSAELDREQALLEKARQWLEGGNPLRMASWTEEEKKRLRGFAFLSEKPLLIVLNVGEEQVGQKDQILRDPQLGPLWHRPQTQATAVCGKLEAELAMMSDSEAAGFLTSYGLTESGRERLIRATHDVLGLIAFFTLSEKECRAWSVPRGTSALQAAGVVHSDLEKHFIRAEVIPWAKLVEAGSLSAARQKGVLRLEGKDYAVQDGDVVYIRHSG